MITAPSSDMIVQRIHEQKKLWESYGQEHVFEWADQLKNDELPTFLECVEQIDVTEINKVYKTTVEHEAKEKVAKHEVKPFTSVTTFADASREQREQWKQLGYTLIAENKVGILLLAGGQASRLGCTFPKGMYDIGLPSGKSLYQLQVERAVRLQKLAARSKGKESCAIMWYIMTSVATYEPTVQYFKEKNFFGQSEKNFFFFNQHMMPCITPEGKIISETASKIAMAPNGNGGLYKALSTSGALAHMASHGIEYVTQYCVDNALVSIADPIFIGFMHESRADCAAKVVPKAYPEEPVGVMAMIDGRAGVIEYSEIAPDMRSARDPATNQLIFNYSHICMNNFTREFLQQIADHHLDDLRYHIASKKIPYANEKGEKTAPPKENGWKMEMFIFDAFAFSKKMVALEVQRDEEFSPLKNGAGAPKDSPETCLADVCRLHTKYIIKAGGSILPADTATSSPTPSLVEISPLTSFAGEDLEPLVKNKTFTAPVHI